MSTTTRGARPNVGASISTTGTGGVPSSIPESAAPVPTSDNSSSASSGPSTALSAAILPSASPGGAATRLQTSVPSATHTTTPSVSLGTLGQSTTPITVVTYRNRSIKTLIDPELSERTVVRHLCANTNLGVQDHRAFFVLRDEANDELVTDDNLRRVIESGRRLKLCLSPAIEAYEMVQKLTTYRTQDRVLKIATYTLQNLIKEAPFTSSFLERGGLRELLGLIMDYPLPGSGAQGVPTIGVNTLAYTLVSLQNLMECFDDGWEEIDGVFVQKCVQILVHLDRINVCRPLTAILKKLVVSGPEESTLTEVEQPSSESGCRTPTSSRPGPRVLPQGTKVSPGRSVHGPEAQSTKINKWGFDLIYLHIAQECSFLRTLVHRLGSPDTTLCLYSFSLLNTLVRHATSSYLEELCTSLDALHFVDAATRLMNHGDEVTICILEMQSNQRRILNWRMHTPVQPQSKLHVQALSFIWLQARISEVSTTDGSKNHRSATAAALHSRLKWRRLGFGSEAVAKEFDKMGWLALRNLESFVRSDPERYARIVSELLQQPPEKRCPLGRASIEVTDILTEFWNVANPSGAPYSYPTATATTVFQPYLLNFERVHALVLRFFLRMWTESDSPDFGRISALVRSWVRTTFEGEVHKTWTQVESAFLQASYAEVRATHLRVLEQTDECASKPSIRHLRDVLYRDAYECVRQQRISCLLDGAWFLNRSPKSAPGTAMWRFYRLAPDRRCLHYTESDERTPIPPGIDTLPSKIDLSQVTDISVSNMAQQIRSHFDPSPSASTTPGTHGAPTKQSAPEAAANLTFGLIRTPDTLVAELRALNQAQFSEWVDGLSMMRGEGGVIRTRNTAEYIQMLTEVEVQVQLLDVTGEQLEVPSSLAVPAPPNDLDYYYAETA